MAAAWLFSVSELFWAQAIIAEVYNPERAAVLRADALVLQGREARGAGGPVVRRRRLGAGLANHWPLMVLAPPGLVLALLPGWRAVLPRLPRLLRAALVTAALPYGWMVWLSQQAPLVSYGTIDTWSDLSFYIGRQGDSGVNVSPSTGWSDRAAFLEWFAADLVRQTTLPGAALALVSLGTLARRGGRAAVAAAGSGSWPGSATAWC